MSLSENKLGVGAVGTVFGAILTATCTGMPEYGFGIALAAAAVITAIFCPLILWITAYSKKNRLLFVGLLIAALIAAGIFAYHHFTPPSAEEMSAGITAFLESPKSSRQGSPVEALATVRSQCEQLRQHYPQQAAQLREKIERIAKMRALTIWAFSLKHRAILEIDGRIVGAFDRPTDDNEHSSSLASLVGDKTVYIVETQLLWEPGHRYNIEVRKDNEKRSFNKRLRTVSPDEVLCLLLIDGVERKLYNTIESFLRSGKLPNQNKSQALQTTRGYSRLLRRCDPDKAEAIIGHLDNLEKIKVVSVKVTSPDQDTVLYLDDNKIGKLDNRDAADRQYYRRFELLADAMREYKFDLHKGKRRRLQRRTFHPEQTDTVVAFTRFYPLETLLIEATWLACVAESPKELLRSSPAQKHQIQCENDGKRKLLYVSLPDGAKGNPLRISFRQRFHKLYLFWGDSYMAEVTDGQGQTRKYDFKGMLELP